MFYYEIIILVTLLFVIMQIVHLFENETLTHKEKNILEITAILILIGLFFEYIGYYLDGKLLNNCCFNTIINTFELSITPFIPFGFILLISNNKNYKIKQIILAILLLNVFFEYLSIFTMFSFFVNKQCDYLNDKLYFVHIILSIFEIVYFLYLFLKSVEKCQNKGVLSLISIILFIIVCFACKLLNPELHIKWLIIAMVYSSFINYYCNLHLKFDVLTGLLNRRSYENQLKKIDFPTVIIRLDVNLFKQINDTYGHHCGDICLKVISSLILENYHKLAWCYRTGGDEFDIIFKPYKLEEIAHDSPNYDVYKAIDDLNSKLDDLLKEQYEKYPMLSNGVSVGYGIFYGFSDSSNEGMSDKRFSAGTISEVVSIADKRMYKNKNKNKNNNNK